MTVPAIFDTRRRQIRLGVLLGEGGEGAVYEVTTDQRIAAKIYNSALTRDQSDKIRAAASLKKLPVNRRVDTITAWPQELLTQQSGAAVGFLMPRFVGYKDIHNLYSPRGRRSQFPHADWRHLIRAAANTAIAFSLVHEAGYVIGDVNQGGILVAKDVTVKLVDCNNFQIKANGRTYLSEGGVEHFTPPELQGTTLQGILRTPNHDNFGLAVLVFQLLFMGRHPFAGRPLYTSEMPIEKAIAECRFPYGARRAAAQMEPPPSTPPLQIVGDEVASLFDRAFSREVMSRGRPPAEDWANALGRLEQNTRQCTSNATHWYFTRLSTCPWCKLGEETGVELFAASVQQTFGPSFDFEAFWRQVLAIAHPGQPPAIELSPKNPTSAALALKGWEKRRNLAAALAAVIPLALLFVGTGIAPMLLILASVGAGFGCYSLANQEDAIADLRRKRDAAMAEWARLHQEWQERASPAPFEIKRAALDRLRTDWRSIPQKRMHKLDELRSNQRRDQLEQFLGRYEIDDARISGIGPGRKQSLISYGIETAADVTTQNLIAVPGFGPVYCSRLLEWRQSLADRFRFDPRRPIDPRDIARVEHEISAERQRIENQLQAGLVELRTVAARITAARHRMHPDVAAAYARHLQATADFNAVMS